MFFAICVSPPLPHNKKKLYFNWDFGSPTITKSNASPKNANVLSAYINLWTKILDLYPRCQLHNIFWPNLVSKKKHVAIHNMAKGKRCALFLVYYPWP